MSNRLRKKSRIPGGKGAKVVNLPKRDVVKNLVGELKDRADREEIETMMTIFVDKKGNISWQCTPGESVFQMLGMLGFMEALLLENAKR